MGRFWQISPYKMKQFKMLVWQTSIVNPFFTLIDTKLCKTILASNF